ncbi:MAG: integrase, partial [Candidatus Sungbacteria bacterium]|nr:integrase [Candidatus Sungbacteria bacterium]
EFYRMYLNPYLNYHRPCGFATATIDARGKEKKVYNLYRTPFDALGGHPGASEFLKRGVHGRN